MANTRTRNQQSPNLEDDDSVEGDLADLTPSAFKHPFVAPPPGAFKTSQITKNQILSEQRELKNWEERCSITKEAVIKTARTIIFSVMIAYLFAILWLAVVGSLGWFVIKKSVS
ncbi:79ba93f7-c383-41ca-a217-f921be1bbd7b [Sclerotinia trifoliorum]|uniref:79ba93f7-c383-41ca-a217-f921be1bbd7b n=1 Tax=Sclerotinia trifoliorum TaxID=28548 RepID=A0A8H2VZZ6_9HELO|nr:79ba93f7-c383-41ca-a217-f921be1bbd7b [Sclerotinia trifoliorum]